MQRREIIDIHHLVDLAFPGAYVASDATPTDPFALMVHRETWRLYERICAGFQALINGVPVAPEDVPAWQVRKMEAARLEGAKEALRYFTQAEVAKAYGYTLETVKKWGADSTVDQRADDILRLAGEGKSVDAIAKELGCSTKTVRRRLKAGPRQNTGPGADVE